MPDPSPVYRGPARRAFLPTRQHFPRCPLHLAVRVRYQLTKTPVMKILCTGSVPIAEPPAGKGRISARTAAGNRNGFFLYTLIRIPERMSRETDRRLCRLNAGILFHICCLLPGPGWFRKGTVVRERITRAATSAAARTPQPSTAPRRSALRCGSIRVPSRTTGGLPGRTGTLIPSRPCIPVFLQRP